MSSAKRCRPAPALADVLVRRVLPRVATLSGATAIHAAALAGQDGGLLLLGPSGAGKSTLSAALAHFLGWEILSDDISILREKDEGADARGRGHRRLRLAAIARGPGAAAGRLFRHAGL